MRLLTTDANATFLNNSSIDNDQIYNDEDNTNHCNMFGSFAMYVQIVLAGLSFMILICNYNLK